MPAGGGGMLAAGMIGSAVIGGGLGYLGSSKAAKAQSKAMAAAIAFQREMIGKAVAQLEAVGIPSIEAQRIVLESPELVGLEEVVKLDPSAFEQVKADIELVGKQKLALERLSQVADQGITPEEKSQMDQILRQAGAQEQARQKAIDQQMQERGMSGSGQDLIMKLQSAQAQADRANQQGLELAAQRNRRALEAVSQMGNMAGSLKTQDIAEQTQRATAADRIAEFNARQRADVQRQNLNRQQDIANARVSNINAQEQYNKELIVQDYKNRLAKAQGIASAYTGGSSSIGHNMMTQAQGAGAKYAALGQLAAGLGGAASGYFGQQAQNQHELQLANIRAGNNADGSPKAATSWGPTSDQLEASNRPRNVG